MKMTHEVGIVYASLATIIALIGLYVALNEKAQAPIPVVTGQVIADYPDQNVPYVEGILEGASVTDSGLTFMCDTHSISNNERMVVARVVRRIRNEKELQSQPAAFAVLNAYGEEYCKK